MVKNKIVETMLNIDPSIGQDDLTNWEILNQLNHNTVIFLTETEKDCQFLRSLKYVAFLFWQDDKLTFDQETAKKLKNRAVFIAISNTPESKQRAEQAANNLQDCKEIKICCPEAPGGGVSDWINESLLNCTKTIKELEQIDYWKPESLADVFDNPPPLKEELIYGILRQGHKMSISGSSKAGKSFALLQLAAALTEGKKWFDTFECKKSKVLYLNMEVDRASMFKRAIEVYNALLWHIDGCKKINFLHLRGITTTIDDMELKIRKAAKDCKADVIIFDPIYKMGIKDENSAFIISELHRILEKIGFETETAIIYCHHFSKGLQNSKNVIDRQSGSGVFARDPDAILTLTNFQNEDAIMLEGVLREFKEPEPVPLIFNFPIHTPAAPELKELFYDNRSKSRGKNKEERKQDKEEQKKKEVEELKEKVILEAEKLELPLNKTDFLAVIQTNLNISKDKSYNIINTLIAEKKLVEDQQKHNNNRKLITLPKKKEQKNLL